MFDIQEFIRAAQSGEQVDVVAFCEYLRGFDHIILWGGGNLGKVIGEKLLRLQVPISLYWDKRAAELVEVNGIAVELPFSVEYDRAKTMVVSCIVNGSLAGTWTLDRLHENGYEHVLGGMDIYEGLICPNDITRDLNTRACLNAVMCNMCACDRLLSIVEDKTGKRYDDGERIAFNVLTFVINQKCSLSCKYCGQYMNAYPENERINFSYKQIVDDIDFFFDAVDSIGVVSVIGGEPFLHPDINKIVKHILTKDNFGVINITTNGICKLTPETLDGFDNERVKISFSKYVDCLSQTHKDLFEKNVQMASASNIIHSVGFPIWNTPGDLSDKCHPVETMMAMKAHCEGIRMCMNVKNGRFFPCSKTEPLHCLNMVDYQNDYIDFSTVSTPMELRGKIREILSRPYFQSCSHCGGDCGVILPQAGEQDSRSPAL